MEYTVVCLESNADSLKCARSRVLKKLWEVALSHIIHPSRLIANLERIRQGTVQFVRELLETHDGSRDNVKCLLVLVVDKKLIK